MPVTVRACPPVDVRSTRRTSHSASRTTILAPGANVIYSFFTRPVRSGLSFISLIFLTLFFEPGVFLLVKFGREAVLIFFPVFAFLAIWVLGTGLDLLGDLDSTFLPRMLAMRVFLVPFGFNPMVKHNDLRSACFSCPITSAFFIALSPNSFRTISSLVKTDKPL